MSALPFRPVAASISDIESAEAFTARLTSVTASLAATAAR